ncbi:HlyD family efflux transporter periplasmic adaptor subunit [Novosphingobium sp. PASSN1]|uniref:efflux RND transporter periplasmic adaptor subunit n=1 Tax=Novosphingobium sp. PASSN1 TaxID=2015561 RepID=UPI0025F91A37|nr:HlyD family efflux transporter periplasmic adaptor subunit [Novosphingobium sp. PASSN1]
MPYRLEHLDHFPTLASMRSPRVVVITAWLVALAIAAAVLVMVFVPWVQTANGDGQVVALNPDDRAADVSALVGGRIAEWYVKDGELVAVNQPIARVVDLDPEYLSRLAAERAQIEAEIASVTQSRATAQLDVNRASALWREGLIARRDVELAQIKVAEGGAKLAESRAKLQRIDVQVARQSSQLVRAPRAGRIQTVNAALSGGVVSAGTILATVVPETATRAVALYVDGRDIALVRPGQHVRLEFEGWPAIQFSGWPSVAQGIFDGRVRALDPTSGPSGLFRVIIDPDPAAKPWPDLRFTKLGAKVRGWIQMETVPVGYELWRQLNDFPLEFSKDLKASMSGKDSGGTAKDDDATVRKAGKPK